MRAVLDTVVFVRALINPHGVWGRLLFDLCDRYVIVTSPEIVREVLEVLHRPKLRERFPQMAALPALQRVLAIIEAADVAEPTRDVRVCRDPGDDKFFACAIAGAADYIVSADNDILAVGEYHGVKTVRAQEFVELLSRDKA